MSETEKQRIERMRTYEHEQFGEVRVRNIEERITAIGPDGVERKHFIQFDTSPEKSVKTDRDIKKEPYEDFQRRLVR